MSNQDMEFVAGQAEEQFSELPMVDDLHVAAAAAAAAMGEPSSSSSEESSSDDSDVDDSSSDDDDMESTSSDEAVDEGAFLAERWMVTLAVDELEGSVKVVLAPLFHLSSGNGLADMNVDPEVEFSSGSDADEDDETSSEEEEDTDEEDIIEIRDYDDLRRVVDAMEADAVDGDGEDSMGGDGGGPSAREALFGDVPLPTLDVCVQDEDAITPAGSILSVIEGTIVVRASAGSRALNEGSVLVLADRTVIGAVEDIFGPVQAPLYALRYTPSRTAVDQGSTDGNSLPSALVPEAVVYSVDSMAQFVLEDELRVKGYDGDLVEESGTAGAIGVDVEQQFSDDEAEAQYKRKLKAKRKGERSSAAGGGGGDATAGAGGGNKAPRQQKSANMYSRGGGGSNRGRGRGSYHSQQQQPQFPQQHQGYQQQYPPYAPPQGFMPPPTSGNFPQQQQQYYPGPPQYLGQYYAQGTMPQQYYPQPPRGQFQAQATAGQLRAMSLQPHHVMAPPPPSYSAHQPPPPPPPSGFLPRPPPPPPSSAPLPPQQQ